MHIYLKKKFLHFNNYKVKCSVGKNGLTKKKIEGDLKTPKGKFKFEYLFYRKDRIKIIKTKIKKRVIKKNMGWCDEPKSNFYNQLIKFPFKYNAEKLFLKKKIYDLILVLNYNTKPVIKNKGSAIFLHIASKKLTPTKGCVAVKKKDLLKILEFVTNKSFLYI